MADLLRLNTGVAPTPYASASRLGLLGGDNAGFPNGRRVFDDVTDIALRVVAGGVLAAPFPGFNADINGRLGDGVNVNDVPVPGRRSPTWRTRRAAATAVTSTRPSPAARPARVRHARRSTARYRGGAGAGRRPPGSQRGVSRCRDPRYRRAHPGRSCRSIGRGPGAGGGRERSRRAAVRGVRLRRRDAGGRIRLAGRASHRRRTRGAREGPEAGEPVERSGARRSPGARGKRPTPTFYREAWAATERSLQVEPGNLEARKLQVWILLGQHEFPRAVEAAEQINRSMPDDVLVYGFLVDGYTELGRYAEAEKAAQWMLDMRPGNVPGLTRAAYLRELFGDHEGAVELMDTAYRRTARRRGRGPRVDPHADRAPLAAHVPDRARPRRCSPRR